MNDILVKAAFLLYGKGTHYKIARTLEERNKIFSFRYEVYQEELGYDMPGTNHDLRIVKDDIDDLPESILFYLEKNGKLIATMRLVIYPEHKVPDKVIQFYSLEKHSWLKNYSICEIERFMARKEFRHKFIILKFIASITAYIIRHNVKITLQYCKPCLVSHFYAIGDRPYTSNLIDYANGLWIPLIGFIDRNYAKKINSPVKFLIPNEAVFSEEQIKEFYNSVQAITFNKKIILKEIEQSLLDTNALVPMPKFILEIFKKLIDDRCYMLYIDQSIKLIHQGMVDKTVYFFIAGAGNIGTKNIFYQKIQTSQLVGEFEMFTPTGKRQAEVILENGTKLFVIKESSIHKLKRYHPFQYIKFLEFIASHIIYKNMSINQERWTRIHLA